MTLYFLTFENTQKFKKYRNVTVLYANNKNINECNKYEFIDEEEDEEEENEDIEECEDNEDNEENDLFYKNNKYLEDNDIVLNEKIIKKKKYKEINNINDNIICLCKTIDTRYPYYFYGNKSKKEIIEFLKEKNILYFNSEIISTIDEFYKIDLSFSILEPNLKINKYKFKLIGNDPNDGKLIEKFKNMDNVLLILKQSYKIICLYKENNKDNFLNKFILYIDDYTSSSLYFTINKANMFLSKNKIETVSQDSNYFPKRFSEILDYKNYKIIELFKIN